MEASAWILALSNALAAATLLTAGLAKHVSPEPVQRALREAVPIVGSDAWPAVLRVFATVEIAVAVALSITGVRMPAAVGAALLGACFVVVGLRGQLSRSTAPCGCFGSSSRRPLGWANVAVGVALVAVGPVNVALDASGEYTAGTVLLTAIGSLALTLYVNRQLILRLLRPESPAATGSQVT